MSARVSGSIRGALQGGTRFVLAILAFVLTGGVLQAQETVPGETSSGPRFLVAANGDLTRVVPLRAESTSVLSRVVTLDLEDARFGDVVQQVAMQAGVHLVFSSDLVSPDRRVTIRAERIPLSSLLSELLRDANVDVVVSGNQATLVRKAPPARRPVARQQTGVITGRVVEAGTDNPIVSAQILVDSVGRGITNEEGFYRITGVAPGKRKVSVVIIGYRSGMQEVEVGAGATVVVNFALEAAPTRLSQLVVTATGEQRRVELGHDIVVINVDSIVKTEPVTSVTDLLEGRVPGLVVQRTSGAPGDPARLRLRGVSSPRLSNDPIVIVDGVRVYSEQSDERGGNLAGGGYAAPSPLDYIDPHSIETIQVIRGPSAATMYGQDAANGVIVITTKRGQPGPPRWTVSAARGETRIAQEYPELYFRWGHVLAESTPVHCPINNRAGGLPGAVICQADRLIRFQMLNDPELTVLDRGQATDVGIGVSGGSSSFTYNITGSYRDEVGLVALPAYEVDRYRKRFGTSPPDWMRRPHGLTRWGLQTRTMVRLGTSADVSLSANLSRTEQQRSSLEQQLGNLMTTYVDKATGKYYERSIGGGVHEGTGEALSQYYERATATATQFTNTVGLTWRPSSWVTTTLTGGLNVVQRRDEVYFPRGAPTNTGLSLSEGSLSSARGTSVQGTLDARTSIQTALGNSTNLRIASGINYTSSSIDDLKTEVRGLAEGTESLNGAAEIRSVGEYHRDQATFGWYIEPGLSYRHLWITTGIRMDGASTFGTRQALPKFPKVSVSYLLSDEPFFPSALHSWVNSLRLRAAYGHAGRQPGPTDRLRLYSSRIAEFVEGELVDAVVIKTLGNTRLKPERSKEFEGGLDADLLDDRMSLSITGYRKTTEDALIPVPVAPSVYGDISQLKNIGVVRNTGVEVALMLEPVRTDLVRWNTQFSLSQNRNVVVELAPGVEPFGMLDARVVPGYPLFSRWATPILGYADVNGDGIIEQHEILRGDTAVYVGGTLPTFTANLHTWVSLLRGSLSVSASFRYESGGTQANDVVDRLAEFSRSWNDPAVPSLTQQPELFRSLSWNQLVDVLRWNSLSIGYQVPTSIAQRIGAQSLGVSVQGSNLGLWTNYNGVDPNVNAQPTGNRVRDNGVLPMPRTWQVRITAGY